jgi:hypothetical protein
MRCPITATHVLVEIAEGLFQCPKCGLGPSSEGERRPWALFSVEENEYGVTAASVLLRDDGVVVVTLLSWELQDGVRIGELIEEPVDVFTEDEACEAGIPLPAIVLLGSPHNVPPGAIPLAPLMFRSPLGRKEISP